MTTPTITANDRLSLTVFLAAVVHGLLILGVGFTAPPDSSPERPPMIEVTLARTPLDEQPKDYDYLAQANQDGGGEADTAQRPRESEAAVLPEPTERDAAATAAPAPSAAAAGERNQVVTAHDSSTRTVPTPTPSTAQQPTTTELVNASPRWAAAQALPVDPRDASAKFPSKNRLDPRTLAHADAAYIHAWVEKVERLGNLNYPEAARIRRLTGRLILEIALRGDGSLYEIRVLSPSQHAVLDQAAVRIVELAAPYAPVPDEVLDGKELLVFTRTLEFVDEGGLLTR